MKQIMKGAIYVISSISVFLLVFLIVGSLLLFLGGNIKYERGEDYISHDDATMSKFASDEYVCSGSCSCSIDSERRSSTALPLIRKSVVYFVTAVSSSVAIQRAKHIFDENCEQLISDSCHSGTHVLSEVDSCEKASPKVSGLETWIESDRDVELTCKGACLPYTPYPFESESKMREVYGLKYDQIKAERDEGIRLVEEMEKTKFKCSELTMFEQMTLNKQEFDEIVLAYEKESSGGLKFEGVVHAAEIQFMVDVLHEFCNKESLLGGSKDADGMKHDKKAAFCVGYNPKAGLTNLQFVPENLSVKCSRSDS